MNPLYVSIVREDRATAIANARIHLAGVYCYRCWQPVETITSDQVTPEASSSRANFAGGAVVEVVSWARGLNR